MFQSIIPDMNLQITNALAKTKRLAGMVAFFCPILLVLLFGYAAFAKLVDYQRFVEQMQLAPVPLMENIAPVLGWLVPLTELIVVSLLFSDRYRRVGLWCSVLLLSVFECYIAWMLVAHEHLPCTCGGIISKMSWKGHLAFNAVFILFAYFSLRINKHAFIPTNIHRVAKRG